MKSGPLGPMPWDMLVFMTITTVGFSYSVQKIVTPGDFSSTLIVDREPAERSHAFGTLDLGCIERKVREAITSEAGTLRLRGRFCHLSPRAMRMFGSVQVKNLSTGDEGTVFFQGYDAGFVTDYLKLKTGRNLIHVEWRETKSSEPKIYVAEVYEK